MNNDAATGRAWTCTTCGRHVPAHVEECRCGAARPAVAAEPAPVQVDAAATTGFPRALLAVAALGLAGLITFAIWNRPAAPPPATTAPAPTERGADAQAASPTAAPAPGGPRASLPAAAAPTQGNAPAVRSVAPASLEDVIAAVLPAIVAVETSVGRGSGFFVAPTLIITNAHVVGTDSGVTVRTGAGTRRGRVARTVRDLDLAVVQVDQAAASAATLPLGSVTRVRPGQEVVAVGSALGVLSNTVTRGIVSAVRVVNGITLVQTDAAINPGNSGGPLIDRSGMVVGITTMKVIGGAESLAFAVAADHVRALVEGGAPPSWGMTSPSDALGAAMGTAAQGSQERLRQDGTTVYSRALALIARDADRLDAFWQQYSGTCLGSRDPARGSQAARAWFVMWERPLEANVQVSGCDDWLSQVTHAAGAVRREVEEADEAARRAGVYPGERREIRHQRRLDWRGWDR